MIALSFSKIGLSIKIGLKPWLEWFHHQSLIYFEISIQTFSFLLIPEVFYLIFQKRETNSAKVGGCSRYFTTAYSGQNSSIRLNNFSIFRNVIMVYFIMIIILNAIKGYFERTIGFESLITYKIKKKIHVYRTRVNSENKFGNIWLV
jgi:hypothetical protein